MTIEFTDTCPSKDKCEWSSNCIMGNYSPSVDIVTARLNQPYIPLLVTNTTEGSKYVCEPKTTFKL